MKCKRYSEEQINSILKEHQAGASVPDLARRHGVVESSIYRGKSKYGGKELSEAKRLCDLEQENAQLRRLLAEAELDNYTQRLAILCYGGGLFCGFVRTSQFQLHHMNHRLIKSAKNNLRNLTCKRSAWLQFEVAKRSQDKRHLY